ncbi:tyrosine-type recombinase/integrase [Tunturiibacter gelidiferens]|uniref:tyrosine-type recombinase/integrase n=1 Tax=Tunturiibacter gelidiferens TaxID=3069689 RepID=UPI003D9BD7E0
MRVKNKTTPDTWFFRYYEDQDGRRVHRNLKIGTVRELPLRRDAETAVLSLRATINSGVRTPETVNDLIAHYTPYELTLERKSHATIENFKGNLKLYIVPKWGKYRLSEVRTVAVEQWLHTLELAPATRTKIRNQMSAIFTHGIRYEFIQTNPISKVRCSSTRLRDPDVLTPVEFRSLLLHLPLRERAMVMLAGSTGLRRSEMFALRWSDLCFGTMQVFVTKAIVRNHVGGCKTPASRKPVPLHLSVLDVLLNWRSKSDYKEDSDFLFPSIRLNGTQPLFPDMVLNKIIRPALLKAGIVGKTIGWHSFRHSLATNLRSMGVDVKVAQELLRHANSRITLDLYTRAVSADKREASGKQFDMLMGGSDSVPSIVPSAA